MLSSMCDRLCLCEYTEAVVTTEDLQARTHKSIRSMGWGDWDTNWKSRRLAQRVGRDERGQSKCNHSILFLSMLFSKM